MKFKEVNVGISRTYNIGNYESIKVSFGATIEVNNGTPNEAFNMALGFIEKKFKTEIEKIKEIV